MAANDPALRSAIARVGAYRKAAIYGKDGTAAARAALSAKFVGQARALLGPDAAEAEVTRSALMLRKAFYADIQAAAVRARAKRKAGRA
jgi:hypothetical protein